MSMRLPSKKRSDERSRRRRETLRPAAFSTVEALESRVLLSVSVTQYHNDAASTGQNLNETVLTPLNVNSSSFGKLYSTSVDGNVYAQPLEVAGVNVTVGPSPGTHNVVYVATMNDSLYAMDANSGTVLWQDSFLVPEPGIGGPVAVTAVPNGDYNTGDVSPTYGITSTPAIDASAGYLYLVANTKQIVNGNTANPHYVYTLHKVNIATGAFTSSVIADTIQNTSSKALTFSSGTPYVLDPAGNGAGVVSANVNGSTQNVIYFSVLTEGQRSAVTLHNGSVYIAFASHGDNPPYHGWILGYNATTLAANAVFNANPNGGYDGIWQGGGSLAFDPQGYMYIETGNGDFDTTLNAQGFPINGDYGDSFVKIGLDASTTATNQNVNGWGLKVVDYFTPFNQANLSGADADLGSGGSIVLPKTMGSVTIGSASHPDLLIGAGKEGKIYLIDRNNMGKYSPNTDHVVQEIGGGLGGGGSYGTASLYYDGANARIYYGASDDTLRAFSIANGVISTSATRGAENLGFTGATASISANGATNGIVWAIDKNSSQLRAYNASNISQELYNSAQNAGRDALGNSVKFTVPLVANGLVYVGTGSALVAYGVLAPPTTVPIAPTLLTAAAASTVQINLAWKNNATDASQYFIEESTDSGSTWTQIASASANATSFPVLGLQPGTPYTFRVRAANAVGYSGYSNNASATTAVQLPPPNFSSGFAGAAGQAAINTTAQIVGSNIRLTGAGINEASSAFFKNTVSIAGFNTSFNFQLVNPVGDGITFTLQRAGPTARGFAGGGLGYASTYGDGGISSSVAIKFDLKNDAGEGNNSTGLFVNGDSPTVPTGHYAAEASIDMTSSGVNLHSGDIMHVALTYDGVTLAETITDTVTQASFAHNYTVNIPGLIGSIAAYVGFTGATDDVASTQNILNWTFASQAALPNTPANLTVTPTSGTELDLSWSDPSSVTTYNILQLIGGTYTQIAQVPGNVNLYQATGLTQGTTNSYEVVAVNSTGSSAPAGPVSGITPTAPASPSNLTFNSLTTTGVTLNWTNNATNATGYRINRQLESNNSQYITTLPATATSFTNTGLLPGRAYDYTVSAINLAGPSAGVNVTIQTVPAAPTGVTTSVGSGQVTLNWTAQGHAVSSYKIYRGTTPNGEGATAIATVTAATYTNTGLSAGTTYYYKITAVDTGGESVMSSEVSAVPAPSAPAAPSVTSASAVPPVVTTVAPPPASNNAQIDDATWSPYFVSYLKSSHPSNAGGYVLRLPRRLAHASAATARSLRQIAISKRPWRPKTSALSLLLSTR
jgi:fibronectin type 3 domain-containing protein